MGSVRREAPRQTTDPSSSGRKLAARKINERVKLGASFLNTLSLAVLGAAIIVPAFNETIHLPPLARWASGRNGLTFSGPMALSFPSQRGLIRVRRILDQLRSAARRHRRGRHRNHVRRFQVLAVRQQI